MASALYLHAKGVFLNGCLDMYQATIEAVLVNENYVYNATHDDLTYVRPYVIGSAQALTVTDIYGGVFDANDVTFTAVTSSYKVSGVVIYQNKIDDESSIPIAYIDCSLTPITPNGSNITVQWDNGPNKIFAL